ncbi:MAG: hypothetical protein NC299_11585 [Lachnospiraceae bacterium]|nr:hypothetical protein [Ruminococcus sp.]MCM1275985.1 hypothetical protein [Lachnospiraceae bacterium]
MRSFFEEHGLDESLSENRARKIKYSVLARVEGEKPMKKKFRFKPLIIAAAAVAAAAASTVTVNALSSGENPPIKINNKSVEAYYTSYVDECGHTVDIYMVDFPEEILMSPPKDRSPAPVGELRIIHGDFDTEDSLTLVDEEGNEFPVLAGSMNNGFALVNTDWMFGKYFQVVISKEGETGHNYFHDGGGVKYCYDMSIQYSPADKSLCVEYHKNLFDTISDIVKGEE